MSEIQISRRYARGLFELAQTKGCVDDVYTALNGLGQVVRQVQSFREFIHNPLLSVEERNKVLANVFEGKVPDLVKLFLLFISFKNRLDLLQEIIEAFDDLYLREHKRARALVVSALPLDEAQKERIRRQLGQKYAKEIVTDWQIKTEILGGFRIFIEGKLHDYSFTSQLEEFKTRVLCHNN